MASFQCELEKAREYLSSTETDEMNVINIS